MGLEDLTRYESAGIAAMNAEKEPGLAVAAIDNFNYGLGEDHYNHPSVQRDLKEAAEGLNIKGHEPQIRNTGVLKSIDLYGGKFEKAFLTTKFSDLVKYLNEDYEIPYETKEALSKYNESTYLDLAKMIKAEGTSKEIKEEIEKAIQAIDMLKNRKLRTKTLDIVNDNTTAMLNQLYPKPKEESQLEQKYDKAA